MTCMKQARAVVANNIQFDSVSKAAKHFNLKPVALCQHLKMHNGAVIYKNILFRYIDVNITKSPFKIREKSKIQQLEFDMNPKIRACPVYCETLNKKFKTITQASEFAKVSAWTMGLKMQVKGRFVDKEGNIYKRLRPMNTNNIYSTSSDHCTKTFAKKQQSKTIRPIHTPLSLETTKAGEKVEIPNTLPIPQEVKPKSAEIHLKEAIQVLINSEKYTEATAVLDILKNLNKK